MLSSQLPGVISVSSFELSYPYSGNLIFLILSASQFDPLHFFRDDELGDRTRLECIRDKNRVISCQILDLIRLRSVLESFYYDEPRKSNLRQWKATSKFETA